MRQFEHIVTRDLPTLFEELDLDDAIRKALTRHVDELKDWMSGILEWHRRCVRYTEKELLRSNQPEPVPQERFSLAPTGLGTSGLRIGAPTAR